MKPSEHFIAFLEKIEALDTFAANQEKHRGTTLDEFCHDLDEEAIPIARPIGVAFAWNDTPEEYDYWNRINEQWEWYWMHHCPALAISFEKLEAKIAKNEL